MIDCSLIDRVPTVAEYMEFRTSVGWGAIDEAAARTGLRRSLYSVCAYREGKLIGFGRVVGDGGCHLLIVDLIVSPEFQRQGVGSRMMEAIMGYVSRHAKPGTMISLMSARGMAPFYERFGFRMRSGERPGMCMVWDGKGPGRLSSKTVMQDS